MERSSPASAASSPSKTSSSDGWEVVLVTSTIPNARGIGVEQRADHTRCALERLGRVHVVYCGHGASRRMVHQLARVARGRYVVVPPAAHVDLGRWLRRLYVRAPHLPAPPHAVQRALARVMQLEGQAPSAVRLPDALVRHARYVHVFRAHLAPLAEAWLDRPDVRVAIDLDDLESHTLAAIAALAARARASGLSWTYAAMAEAAWRFEQRWLPRFARLAVCSEPDRSTLAARFPRAEITVLPNVVDTAHIPRLQKTAGATLQLLFVGALGYYPNLDAVRFLVGDVLPRLRAAGRRFSLHIAGRGAHRAVRRILAGGSDVSVHESVSDLSPLYERADVALCPVRAGGGSRIKILEAFAHGVPVVATRAGAAGLAVAHGCELLLADDAADFATAIAALGATDRAAAISERARAFVVGHHDTRHFDRSMRKLAGAHLRDDIVETIP